MAAREANISETLTKLVGEQKRQFASAQITYQRELEEKIKAMFDLSKSDLSTFLNARKMAAKYKK